jgi:hypothetical protein
MGNSRWRLETSVNLALLNAKEANFLEKLEIIISDWGSEVPLSEVLSLVPEAKEKVSFVHIPAEIAQKEQKDSKFPEVIALNAAARRASGEYIGRIDNDTIVGKEFYSKFKNCIDNKGNLWFKPENVFMFVERRSIPYRISHKSFPLFYIEKYLKWFGEKLKVESAREWSLPFWWSPVGIMIFHREIWDNSNGYNEKLIYWGWMEGDLALRLAQKHHLIDFKDHVGNHLYHLEHYSNLIDYKDRNGPATPRKKNTPVFEELKYSENDENWGLFDYRIVKSQYDYPKESKYESPIKYSFREKFAFLPRIIIAILKHQIDNITGSIQLYYGTLSSKTKISLGHIKKKTRDKIRH